MMVQWRVKIHTHVLCSIIIHAATPTNEVTPTRIRRQRAVETGGNKGRRRERQEAIEVEGNKLSFSATVLKCCSYDTKPFAHYSMGCTVHLRWSPVFVSTWMQWHGWKRRACRLVTMMTVVDSALKSCTLQHCLPSGKLCWKMNFTALKLLTLLFIRLFQVVVWFLVCCPLWGRIMLYAWAKIIEWYFSLMCANIFLCIY